MLSLPIRKQVFPESPKPCEAESGLGKNPISCRIFVDSCYMRMKDLTYQRVGNAVSIWLFVLSIVTVSL